MHFPFAWQRILKNNEEIRSVLETGCHHIDLLSLCLWNSFSDHLTQFSFVCLYSAVEEKIVNGTDRVRKELVIWFLLKILHGSRPLLLQNKLSTNVWINIHVQLEYGSVYGLQFNNKPLSPCIFFFFNTLSPFWIPSFRPYFQWRKRSHVFSRSYSHWFN